jgi:tetratricopeptide (TPR) repeat protein
MRSHRPFLLVFSLGILTLIGTTKIVGQPSNNETWGCPAKNYKCQLDALTRALQANPKDPENYYNIGLVFLRSGACKEAVESFGMYLAIPGVKPELQADGYNNRGICQRRLNKPHLAYEDHTRAIDLNAKKPEYFVNRANDAGDMGKIADALSDYSRAIAIDPKFALAYSNRGNHHLAMKNLDLALSDLTKAIQLDPSNPEPFYTRAMVYRRKSDFGKAIPDLDQYIALDPGNPKYLADGHVNRAIAYASLNKLDLALKDASKAIELAPGYYDAYMVRAYIFRQLKKDDLANADETAASKLKGSTNKN